jgi:TonB family protein
MAPLKFRSGRCNNDMFCSLASGGHAVSVPLDGNFVCPQCSKPLVAAANTQRRSPLIVAALAGGGFALAGSGLFAAGTFMGSGSAATKPPAQTEPASPAPPPAAPVQMAMTEIRPNVAAPAAIPPDMPADAAPPANAPAAAAQTEAAPPPSAPAVAVTVNVGERRFRPWPEALAGGTEGTQLKYTVAARQLVLPLPASATPGHPAVLSAEAQAAAKVLAEQQRREQLAAKEEAAREAMAAEQKRLAIGPDAAPLAQGPAHPAQAAAVSRPFAAVAIAGGAPDYPDAYADETRSGHVTVSCRIERDGSPHKCHIVESRGGAAFGKSVLKWLGSGRVRYQPVVRNGTPVAEAQQWSVNFVP